ncbi:MAG: hypothetical protein H6825_00610 [Planctomycetes bacterium]|nr:hypothetical protein [Planctomycetota bacterium]
MRASAMAFVLTTLAIAASASTQSSCDSAIVPACPTALVPNSGQWDPDLLYALPMRGGAMQVRREGLYFAWADSERPGLLRLDVADGRYAEASQSGRRSVVNFYGPGEQVFEGIIGSEAVCLSEVRPGLDLTLHARGGVLGLSLRIAAGSADDPVLRSWGAPLDLSCDGRTARWASGSGILSLQLGQARSSGLRLTVSASVEGDAGLRLATDGWSRTSDLTIDAELAWSTFLGGSSGDGVADMVVLDDESVALVGSTSSLDFPTTPNAWDSEAGLALSQAFVSRLSADGSELLYSTYVTHDEESLILGFGSIAARGLTALAVAGLTNSPSAPVTGNAFQPGFAGGVDDGIVAEFDLASGALTYMTYVGGSGADQLNAVAYAPGGQIVAAGKCLSPEFPTSPWAMQPVKAPFFDGLIVVLDPSLSGSEQLVDSTFFGGSSSEEEIREIEVASDGDIVVLGLVSSDYPMSPQAYDPGPYAPGSYLPFVARLVPDLSQAVASTFVLNALWDIGLDSSGRVAFCGGAGAASAATPDAYDETYHGKGDMYVGVLSPGLDVLEWGSFLGGSEPETAYGVALDDLGTLVVTGRTSSPDFPTTPGALDTEYSGGGADAFVSVLTNHGSTLGYSTFLGGSGAAAAWGWRVQSLGGGDFVVTGKVAASGFPVTPGAFDETPNDIFITHFDVDLTWATLAQGLAGASGVPVLTGTGSLEVGATTTLTVKRALAASTSWLVVGASALEAPFKQGTLVPSPDIVVGGIPIDSAGTANLSFAWPGGIPAGVATFYQVWIADPAGPAGFSASNGLQGLTP